MQQLQRDDFYTATLSSTSEVDTQIHQFNRMFSPIPSEHNSGYYRVVMEQIGNVYTIHTGDNMTRILEESFLPKEIRVKLTMIKAYENHRLEEQAADKVSSNTFNFQIWSHLDAYVNNTFPTEFNDIGWRVHVNNNDLNEVYCVVTTAETLDLLRGKGSGSNP